MPQYLLRGKLGDKPLRFDLKTGTQIVGRDAQSDIQILDKAISRRHAEIDLDENGILVRDLGSLNGTFVNADRVTGEASVRTGDTIRFGHTNFTLAEVKSERTPFIADDVQATFTTTVQEIRQQAVRDRSENILAALHDAGQMLSRRTELDDLYVSMLDLLERFIKADRILILPPEIAEGHPEPIAARLKGSFANVPLRLSRKISAEIIGKGKAFITADAAKISDSLVGLGIHAAMGAPLFDNDRILGAVYVDSKAQGQTYGEDDLRLLTLLSNMIAVKITNSRLEVAEEEQRRIREEIDLASNIQRHMLPRVIPNVEGYEIFAHQTPCYEVGGDLYDVRVLPDGKIWLILGDVSGKGVGAALLMAYIVATLQVIADEVRDPLELVNRLESYLEPRTTAEQYVTIFAGLLDPVAGTLEYVNAGHNPPQVLCGGSCKDLDSTGGPVALVPGLPRTASQCTMEGTGTLLVFSDGVPECENGAGEFYGEGPLEAFLARSNEMDATTLGMKLIEDVEIFRGDEPPGDDLTLLVLKRP